MESAAILPRLDDPKLYRPRRPERSPFYAVLHQFFDRFTREYEQCFERTFGPLRGIVSSELVERMRTWRHSGFHAFAGEEIPDISDALRVGLYMVRGPAATSRLRADPAQEPKVRYLAKGTVPDHGEEGAPHPACL
jgi:hypothetical protein